MILRDAGSSPLLSRCLVACRGVLRRAFSGPVAWRKGTSETWQTRCARVFGVRPLARLFVAVYGGVWPAWWVRCPPRSVYCNSGSCRMGNGTTRRCRVSAPLAGRLPADCLIEHTHRLLRRPLAARDLRSVRHCAVLPVGARVCLVTIVTWLILPVVICLSQRLSHACLSISMLCRNCRRLIKTVMVYLMVP